MLAAAQPACCDGLFLHDHLRSYGTNLSMSSGLHPRHDLYEVLPKICLMVEKATQMEVETENQQMSER